MGICAYMQGNLRKIKNGTWTIRFFRTRETGWLSAVLQMFCDAWRQLAGFYAANSYL